MWGTALPCHRRECRSRHTEGTARSPSPPLPQAPKQHWGRRMQARWLQTQAPPQAPPGSPLPELLEEDAVGEALATDADALQDTITAQLVQHQLGLQLPRLRTAGRTCSVSGRPLGGATHPRETRWKGLSSLNGWQFHPGQPTVLSTYYVPGTNACPGGAHGPVGETDNN